MAQKARLEVREEGGRRFVLIPEECWNSLESHINQCLQEEMETQGVVFVKEADLVHEEESKRSDWEFSWIRFMVLWCFSLGLVFCGYFYLNHNWSDWKGVSWSGAGFVFVVFLTACYLSVIGGVICLFLRPGFYLLRAIITWIFDAPMWLGLALVLELKFQLITWILQESKKFVGDF